jgi:thiol-disulfide isomerase/thioredoxin
MLACAALAVMSAVPQNQRKAIGPKKSPVATLKPIPDFTMETTEGKTITAKSLRGKVILIDFWATWCKPCMLASPTMERLHKKFGSKGLVIIGANTGEESSKKGYAAAQYKSEHKYTYTFTRQNDRLAVEWGIQGLPSFILIDKKGVVREGFSGWHETQAEPMIEGWIKKYLAAK